MMGEARLVDIAQVGSEIDQDVEQSAIGAGTTSIFFCLPRGACYFSSVAGGEGALEKKEFAQIEIPAPSAARLSRIVVNGNFPIELADRYRVLELVRTPDERNRLSFLTTERGEYKLVQTLEYGGKTYSPPDGTLAPWPNLALPEGVCSFGSTALELMSDIGDSISEYVDLSPESLLIVNSILLASWFPECFEIAPILWLVGPPGSAKTKLIRLMACFARRAYVVGDIRAGSLYKMTDTYAPTLLIDELEDAGHHTTTDVYRFLRAGTTPGTPTVRNGVTFTTYGFKIIASRQPPLDQALLSRAVTISMLPSPRESKPLQCSLVEELTRRFQPRLLDFRIKWRNRVSTFRLPAELIGSLTPRARQIAGTQCAPLQDDPDRTIRLIEVLAQQDEVIRVERSLEPEWQVTEALFRMCHEVFRNGRTFSDLLVGGVSEEVNRQNRAHGEEVTLGARKVGAVLRSLGFRTVRLGSLGRGFRITRSFLRKVHEVAQRLGVNRATIAFPAGLDAGNAGAPCPLCEEFDLMAGLRTAEMAGFHIPGADETDLTATTARISKTISS